MKYVTVEISGIVTQIAKPTDIKGYTEGVMECFLPDEQQMQHWDAEGKQEAKWIKENNKRMNAICKFLNDNDL
jgi:hypothetical protein